MTNGVPSGILIIVPLVRDTGGDADVLALYDDGDMHTFAADEFDVAAEGA